MEKSNFRYSFSDLKLSVSQIEKIMGYKEGESHEMVSEIIDRILKEAESISSIKAEYTIFDKVVFNTDEKSVDISGTLFNLEKIVYNQIRKSDSIAIFLCTAGKEIGVRSRKLMSEGDLLGGYVYDVVGSEIVEAATDLMQNTLKLRMSRSEKKITNRYSPGYCGWGVEEQHKLFRFLPYNFCGIRLTPSALMDPVKSVSGFIGIGNNVRFNSYTCRLCDMKECIYRSRKNGVFRL